jgi:hypothetical protein
VEWLEVKALSSSPSAKKKKKERKRRIQKERKRRILIDLKYTFIMSFWLCLMKNAFILGMFLLQMHFICIMGSKCIL